MTKAADIRPSDGSNRPDNALRTDDIPASGGLPPADSLHKIVSQLDYAAFVRGWHDGETRRANCSTPEEMLDEVALMIDATRTLADLTPRE